MNNTMTAATIEADPKVPIIRVTRDFVATPARVFRAGPGLVVVHLRQHGVQPPVARLGPLPVPLDPLRHQVEDLRLQVHRAAVARCGAADQARLLQHLQVLGDRLDADPVRRGQLAHGGVAVGQSRHQVAPRRVGQGGIDLRQRVAHLVSPSSTI